MGALRACYTTTARLTRGGPLVRLVWYWAEPGAPIYHGWHVFAPVLLVEDKYDVPDTVGEVPYARRKFYDGTNPFGYPFQSPCGTAEDFLGQGTPPTLPNGRPDFARWCGCDYRATIGFGCGHTNRPRFVGELAFEAAGREVLVYRGIGELAWEGEGSEILTASPSGVGELAFEAEADEVLGGSESGVGELAFEAEADETLITADDWVHAESGGMTWTEFSAFDVKWSAEDSANCGGTNAGRQQGLAHRSLTLAADTDVLFELTGRTERQNNSYDVGYVLVDGGEEIDVGGSLEELGCGMGAVAKTVTLTLTAGTHLIEFGADTVDGNYHVGAFWRLRITASGVDSGVGELAFEAEADEVLGGSESGVGELAFEAEADEVLGGSESGVGELAFEAEADET